MNINHLTPVDIVHKEFSGSLFGYNKKQVQEFLQEVSELLEQKQKKINSLEEKFKSFQLKDQKSDYHSDSSDNQNQYTQINHEMISKALILAEKTKEDIIRNAKDEAKNIVSGSEIEAKKKVEEAKHYLNILEHQFYNLKEQKRSFLLKFRAELTSLLDSIKNDEFLKDKQENVDFDKKPSQSQNNVLSPDKTEPATKVEEEDVITPKKS